MEPTPTPEPPRSSESPVGQASGTKKPGDGTKNSSTSSTPELGFEFVVDLLLFAFPYGAEQMNLPHLFWLGFGCWVVGIVIAIRMFWIFPLWSHRLSPTVKGLTSFGFIVLFVFAFYGPIMDAYRKRNEETRKPFVHLVSAQTQARTNSQSATASGSRGTNSAGNITQNGNGTNNAAIGNNNRVGNTYTVINGEKWSGWLKPANKPNPVFSCPTYNETNHTVALGRPYVPPVGAKSIYFGGSVFSNFNFPMVALQIGDKPVLTLDKSDDGLIGVSTAIFDSDPNPRIIAKIEKGRFTINRNNVFTMELSPDGSSLRVIDQHDLEVLNVQYLNHNAITITGILYFPGVKGPIKMTDRAITYGDISLAGNCGMIAEPGIGMYTIRPIYTGTGQN